ncbi:MAG: GTPase HflX [Endomicrobium sp.]|jgi:GTP-binding protein HflX|nr:GTPase HflX [Endomicrobium sp.]
MEKIILVGVQTKNTARQEVENSLGELESLCLTDGAQTIEKIIQKRDVPDPAYFIGYGKAAEIKETAEKLKADAVVFDDSLKPVQQRNLEKLIDIKVVDRTRIILDIFAYRARTKEGKLQVERAEMTYHAARLASQGVHLDSQTGGIGTRRGPGERKIETDKRKIRDRIAELDREIEKIKERRAIQRNLRDNSDLPEVAIAGYTNAGKSTLLAALSKSKVYADDKLFATLDPLTRKIKLPGGRDVLLTDTVGFINKLPHDLVAAFRSTMEEILRAKCILHVVDASNPDRKNQIRTVLSVLKDIGADKIPLIAVFNKADKLDGQEKLIFNTPDTFVISAKNSTGMERLLDEIEKRVVPFHCLHKINVGYENQDKIGAIYKLSNVKSEKYNKKTISVTLECSGDNWEKIKNLFNRQIREK